MGLDIVQKGMARMTRRQFAAVCDIAMTAGWLGVDTKGESNRLPETLANFENKKVMLAGADDEPAGEATWNVGPPMPDERTEVKAAALGDRLYVVGGIIPENVDDSEPPLTNEVAVYDPTTEEWEYTEPMPEALHHVSIVSTDEQIYVLGGFEDDFEAVDSVWLFDGEEWESGAPLPTSRGALTAEIINDRIYVAGGVNGDNALTTLEVYDPETDEWEAQTSMPTPREHLASGVVDEKLYVIAGRVGFDNTAANEVYDPETDAWGEEPPISTARSGHDATTVDDRIYIFGGESPERTFDETELYYPAAEAWETLEPMPTPRHGLGTASIAGDIYTVSGGPEPGFTFSSALEILER